MERRAMERRATAWTAPTARRSRPSGKASAPPRLHGVTLRRSPLDAAHRDLGAKMVPFGGWDMPVSYPSGTIAEHRACRSSAVAFDVRHPRPVRGEGGGGHEGRQAARTNDLGKN